MRKAKYRSRSPKKKYKYTNTRIRKTEKPKFEVGQEVEFYSSQNGGCWKHGTVAVLVGAYSTTILDDHRELEYGDHVRIDVGNGVHVVRPVGKCRRVKRPMDKSKSCVEFLFSGCQIEGAL